MGNNDSSTLNLPKVYINPSWLQHLWLLLLKPLFPIPIGEKNELNFDLRLTLTKGLKIYSETGLKRS